MEAVDTSLTNPKKQETLPPPARSLNLTDGVKRHPQAVFRRTNQHKSAMPRSPHKGGCVTEEPGAGEAAEQEEDSWLPTSQGPPTPNSSPAAWDGSNTSSEGNSTLMATMQPSRYSPGRGYEMQHKAPHPLHPHHKAANEKPEQPHPGFQLHWGFPPPCSLHHSLLLLKPRPPPADHTPWHQPQPFGDTCLPIPTSR